MLRYLYYGMRRWMVFRPGLDLMPPLSLELLFRLHDLPLAFLLWRRLETILLSRLHRIGSIGSSSRFGQSDNMRTTSLDIDGVPFGYMP